jgi:hypothetical protein
MGRKGIAGMALAVALTGTQLTMVSPAKAAAGISETQAAAAPGWSSKKTLRMGYHDRCKGWHRLITPYKTGGYIKTSRQVHCAKGEWSRQSEVKVLLQQYRGLGYWRTKATKSAKKGRAAFTVALTASWKCSGGSQLYRNETRVHLYSALRGSEMSTLRKRTEERRIRC